MEDGADQLPDIAAQIITRLYAFDTGNGLAPSSTYGGGCYLIARAVNQILGDKYRMHICGLKKRRGDRTILTPHVVCIGPHGALVDAKFRFVHATSAQESMPYTPRFRMGGFYPDRPFSDYVLNVTRDDFTDDQTSFGDTYRATYIGLFNKIATGRLSHEWSQALRYITA